MVAQHVELELPTEILEYSLTSTYVTLDPALKESYERLFTGGAQPGTDEPAKPADEASPATDGQSGNGETGVSESGLQPEIAEPNGDPSEGAGAGVVFPGGAGDETGGIPIVVRLLIPVVGAALAWLFYRWFIGARKNRVANNDAVLDPGELYDRRNDPLVQAQTWNASVAVRYQGEGGSIAESGWFAPTFGQVVTPGAAPEGDPNEWTGYFLNANTHERVEMSDPAYADLLAELGMTAPEEYSQSTSVPEGFVRGNHLGEAPASVSDPEATDEQPVIRSHSGAPPQAMTAREEALGLAEGMVGIVIDGWHRLPWEVGSDFFVKADGRTYRELPVADVDVLTDVHFLGEPEGFEPDASKYAYWLHEDGTLKIGAPDDPDANSEAAPSDRGEPLEALLPMPGEGQSLLDVANERLIRAHELTGGNPPVEGWIAPSIEAHGAALLSDADLRPGLDPGSWSGHFFNTETGEWANATDPRYEQLAEQLGVDVSPESEPIEASEPISMEGDVLP
jgi:hypothetical protein